VRARTYSGASCSSASTPSSGSGVDVVAALVELGGDFGEQREAGFDPTVVVLPSSEPTVEHQLRSKFEELGIAQSSPQPPTLAPQGWEGNRSRLSGRLIRGYRHWRHKR